MHKMQGFRLRWKWKDKDQNFSHGLNSRGADFLTIFFDGPTFALTFFPKRMLDIFFFNVAMPKTTITAASSNPLLAGQVLQLEVLSTSTFIPNILFQIFRSSFIFHFVWYTQQNKHCWQWRHLSIYGKTVGHQKSPLCVTLILNQRWQRRSL